jgi:hypothetical protein
VGMPPLPFAVLYLACLGLCLGSMEAVRHWVPTAVAEVSVQSIERIAVAVPPRPEGSRRVQGEGGERVNEAQCRTHTGQFWDVCFHHLARQKASTDLTGAVKACGSIRSSRTRQECLADTAELHAPTSRARALALCPTIAHKKWRDQCVFGIALAVVGKDPQEAFTLCDQAGMWRDFCRHDVNGEIAVVSLTQALEHCASEQGGLLTRKSCWHGIGKYIARVDVPRALDACQQVPQGLYRENCVHGLGWGAAEKGGVAFAMRCGMAGPEADSCRLGVAYNHRRFDKAAAEEVCTTVRRPDLRSQCQAFVRTGRITGSPG